MSAASTRPLTSAAQESDFLQSGATVGKSASARAGYIPLALEHIVLEGLATIPVFLRTLIKRGPDVGYQFTLYCSPGTRFAEEHRNRLRQAGVKFIYIPIQSQMQFRQQVEAHLEAAMADPTLTINAKSELVYETSVELIDELLLENDVHEKLPRLESVAKAVTTLVMKDASAFSHLFAASQHDFYTATHMVNVGTWMISLAYALGIRDMDELNLMCLAGMVHDIGKIFIPEEVLNKKGLLTESDRRHLRDHPVLGFNHLKKCESFPELALRVTLEHHERMDGTGYPARLKGDKLHLASRICAVVDSFDAMTAFRPFKTRTESFASALQILQKESSSKYDPEIVAAWISLMQRAESDGVLAQSLDPADGIGKRAHERFSIECPAMLHIMSTAGGALSEIAAHPVKAHSFSRSGLGFLSPNPISASEYVRVRLHGAGSLHNRVFDGQIAWCRPCTDGWHQIGMRFASLLAEQQVAATCTELTP